MASAVANMEEGGNYDSFTGPQESIFGYEFVKSNTLGILPMMTMTKKQIRFMSKLMLE